VQVATENAVPVLVAHLDNGPDEQPRRVVHPDVDAAPLVNHAPGKPIDSFSVARVAVDEDAVDGIVTLKRDARQPGARRGESRRDRGADPARGARDDHAPLAHVESGRHGVTV
jgi:hypothetical protein